MSFEVKDRFDHLLDSALTRLGDAEPREGLEQRVLARLQAPPARSFRPLAAALVAAAAAIVIVAGIALNKPKENGSTASVPALPPAQPHTTQTAAVAKTEARPPRFTKPVAAVPSGLRQPQPAEERPRRARFPTPVPAGPQEVLFSAYARRTPQAEQILMANRVPLPLSEEGDRNSSEFQTEINPTR